MVADVKEHLTQRLGHKADHRKRAEDFEGRDPKTGELYATPTQVVARAKVVYDLAIKAGVQDLPGSHYAWKTVHLLGKIFPMYDTNLGAMIRQQIMSTDVDADTLTLDRVATLADKLYTTWRTYDNSFASASGLSSAAVTTAATAHEAQGSKAGPAPHEQPPPPGSQSGINSGHQQEPPHVNAMSGWNPMPNTPPSEAGTAFSMAELRSQLREDMRAMLLEMGLGATPAPSVHPDVQGSNKMA